MSKTIFEISDSIIHFLKENESELPIDEEAFQSFVRQAISYLSNIRDLSTPQLQRDFLRSNLLPLEVAGKGSFRFTLDHGSNAQRAKIYDPTIQITSTSGSFHAVIIKRSPNPLGKYEVQKTITSEVGTFQIGHVTNRLATNVNLRKEYPELYNFKQKCSSEGMPIIYMLGAARQFPLLSPKHAKAVEWQKDSLDRIFHISEARYGDKVVYGTGGWAGKIEGSMGVPRLGYLGAAKRNKIILTTMPHCGTYDRHENSTLEVFCGQEWGDDSPVLAKMCDGAFVFGSFGAWTRIEIQNLLIQKKPFVVLDNPEDTDLEFGEEVRKVETPRGYYYICRDIEDAANFLFDSVDRIANNPNMQFTGKPRGCNYGS